MRESSILEIVDLFVEVQTPLYTKERVVSLLKTEFDMTLFLGFAEALQLPALGNCN